MKKIFLAGAMVVLVAVLAGGCSGPPVTGPLTVQELKARSGAGNLDGLAIVLYFEELSEPEAQGLYGKLVGLGMRDLLIEPGLGVGGPQMIMYRSERLKQAQWLKANLWELKNFGLMEEKSSTDIYINTW